MNSRSDELITAIETVRGTNNICWMSILKIAMDANPAETKKVLKAINGNDRRISELLGKLADE